MNSAAANTCRMLRKKGGIPEKPLQRETHNRKFRVKIKEEQKWHQKTIFSQR
ncbi:hypothetical protein BRYFOR_07115 [Marvinbryantia formatexigens DSM 14469]|uniref:Uncharacterized protein n=1 Tax=Marvinbryantia formatexigens DSM 14469 TaxID=478749 RepID=C6LER4_9FIRM|nr:hypothetical protein BRYFOR_07115 [Marvinbryantia formatexigens DSM 14469]